MKSSSALCIVVLVWIGLVAVSPVLATDISGNTTTMPYYYQEDVRGDERTYLALFQTLEVGAYGIEGVNGLNVYFSGWGRLDALEGLDVEGDSPGEVDLGSAYLNWRQEDGLVDLSVGRRLVYIGPAAERIDGLTVQVQPIRYLGLQAFGGIPVISEVGAREGDLAAGGRIYTGWLPWVEIGLSAAIFNEEYRPDRRVFGGDVSVLAVPWFDFSGWAYYDDLYSSLYDANATLTFRPLNDLKILVKYLHLMPTAQLGLNSIFSVFTFETADKVVGQVRYLVLNRLVVSGEYNYYLYSEKDSVQRYGGSAGVLWGKGRQRTFGIEAFRLDREQNGDLELRAYLYQAIKYGLFVSADAKGLLLDEKLDDLDRSYYGTASLGWEALDGLTVQASGFYLDGPYRERDYRALVKLAYNFQTTFGKND